MTGIGMKPLGGDDPQRLGVYRLLGRLGSGGMGRIYLARSTADGSLVAVKTLLAEGLVSETDRRRFAREVTLARRIDSAFTARVRGADPDAERPWMAIEYIPAPALSELVRSEGRLPGSAVRWIAAGTAQALVILHEAGIVHRDVKPQNILLPLAGPRLIDFGISHANDITRTSLTLGTIAFTSPEQARAEPSTTASDVYSLGATLFHLAVGRPPYPDTADTIRLLTLVQRGALDLTGLPKELIPLIRPCLAADPGERPEPADVLRQFLEELDRSPTSRRGERWLPPRWTARIEAYEAHGRALREDGGAAPAEALTVDERTRQVPPPGPTRVSTAERAAREERAEHAARKEREERAARQKQEEKERAERERRAREARERKEAEDRRRAAARARAAAETEKEQRRERDERARRQRAEQARGEQRARAKGSAGAASPPRPPSGAKSGAAGASSPGPKSGPKSGPKARAASTPPPGPKSGANSGAKARAATPAPPPSAAKTADSSSGCFWVVIAVIALVVFVWKPWDGSDTARSTSSGTSGGGTSGSTSSGTYSGGGLGSGSTTGTYSSGGTGSAATTGTSTTGTSTSGGSTGERTASAPTTPASRTPTPADRAFASVRAGDCLDAYQNGYGSWSRTAPQQVGCGAADAYLRVLRVAETGAGCTSGGGRGSWWHTSVDRTFTNLCVERQFRTGQCFLAKAAGGRPGPANLLTAWSCSAGRVPREFSYIMQVTAVLPASAGTNSCPADPGHYRYSWNVYDGRTMICAKVA